MIKLAHTVLVIFGITGDLARRKLLPALYNLSKAGVLPEGFRIIGISRKGTTSADIIDLIKARVPKNDTDCDQICKKFEKIISIVDMNIGNTDEYTALATELSRVEEDAKHPLNRLFYLAIPSALFATVTTRLGESDLNIHEKGIRESRYLIEKPFGSDFASAQDLIHSLDKLFGEPRIFRIDHYLAKETAQNILAFRFANPLFSSSWNRHHISHIMVTASESIGIEGRTSFYEGMGALRDIIQSHLLQLLALVTMAEPKNLSAAEIHTEKEKLLAAVRPPEPGQMEEKAIRGQYATYKKETGVLDSLTETYAAIQLTIENDDWRGVPIFVRTGKALKEKVTEITLVYTDIKDSSKHNYLTIRIQPNEGIAIDLSIKKPGFDTGLQEVQLDFCYREKIGSDHIDAYERVLFDGIRSDNTLFATGAEVLSCWNITEPILEAWKDPSFPLYLYENGSAGPEASNIMIEKSGVSWLSDTHSVCTPVRLIHQNN